MSETRTQQTERDEWLRQHEDRLRIDTPAQLALAMRDAGQFSRKTSLGDIRGWIHRRCIKLRLPVPFVPSPAPHPVS